MVSANANFINELVAMGFPMQQARMALEKCNNDKEEAINWIFAGNDVSYDLVDSSETDDINKVIAISMQDKSSASTYSFDPISPEDRVRKPEVPVGLRNVGNTCYFNSLLQAYFMIPEFVREILSFKEPLLLNSDSSQQSRLQSASLKLVKQLQLLFSALIRSHRRYLDPSNVLNALVDDFGNQLMIGDQKDVGEFNMIFVSRLEDGMKPIKPDVDQQDSEEQPLAEVGDPEPVPILVRKGSLNYSITVPEEGAIASLFYGRQVELLTSTEEDGARVFQHQEAIFGQVMLNVDDRDIYSAWDKVCFSKIEGYVTPQTYQTTAEQEVWLTRLPKVLLFQIQRVIYDKESQASVKKHSVFNIDKVIYPDRFMHHNRAIGTSLRKQVNELKAKVVTLETTLKKYEHYASDSLSLEKVLRNASSFVLRQLRQDGTVNTDFTTEATEEQLAQSMALLTSYAEQAASKVQLIKSELADLQAAINAVFDLDELKQHAYNLHSILVHDGMAGSGHYYAYIYDNEHNIWRKYSDISVTEVSEQEVFEKSIGGFSMTSAYCLMYVAASLDSAEPGQVLRSYAFVDDPEVIPDVYSSLLPLDLRREVDDDNIKFKRELEDFRSNQVIKLVQDTYIARFTTAHSQCMSYRSLPALSIECNKFFLINLAIYLKIKYEERIFRYLLFDQVCKEVFQQSIVDMDKTSALYSKLANKLIKSHKDMPYSLDINAYEVQRLEKLTTEFRIGFKDAQYNLVLVRSLLDGDFLKTYAVLRVEYKRNMNDITPFQRFPKEIAKVGAYFLMTAVKAYLKVGSVERALEYLTILVPWVLDFSTSYDILYRQVVMTLRQACKSDALSDSSLKREFEEMNKALETLSPVRPELTLPQEYLEIGSQAESVDFTGWIEGWRSDSLSSHYNELMVVYKAKYSKWLELNMRLTNLRRILTERELTEFEEKTAPLHLN